MPLGLESSSQLQNYWMNNTRRNIFYAYPNGTAPLTGLLSLTDTQTTPQPQFGWNEQRWTEIRTTTIAGPTANNVFYTGGTTTSLGNTPTLTTSGSPQPVYRIYVADASIWQADDTFKIFRVPLSGGNIPTTELSFRVVGTNTQNSSYNWVEAVIMQTAPGAIVNNASSVVGLYVVFSGSSFAEGSRSRVGRYQFPVTPTNYTQIFKTAFSLTGTGLKANLTYDKSGDYKNQLKTNGINHLAGIERALMFGDRSLVNEYDADGNPVQRRSLGGLIWFLKQWELGHTSNGGAFDYRADKVDISGVTDFIAERRKRIIRLNGNSISLDSFNYMESLPFQRTNATEWCKLCLAGTGYIAKVNARLEKSVQKTELRGEEYAGWDFKVTMREGLAGTIYYKSHPLFNEMDMFNSAIYIDLGFLKYRPMNDRDTEIQQCIQLPDADVRKDQWLTEAGLEIAFPEAHMFVDNLGGITL